ncbi:MAG: hypothetical protein M1832_000274 [Thelocarpon impressellum]|nr:MAG: hypothetical protein M1832_000274 [Thelocarpon impressellum]
MKGPHKLFPYDSIQSYAGRIEFRDKAIPGDHNRMSDAQLINLVKLAYDEMLEIWSSKTLSPSACPRAMIGMESEGTIYFASSIRSVGQPEFNVIDADIENSIGWFQKNCVEEGMGPHRTGGACAEISVLRVYGDLHRIDVDDRPRYGAPPRTSTGPRVAVWGRPGLQKGESEDPKGEPPKYFDPCEDDKKGWGCRVLVQQYGLRPVSRQLPDISGQDDSEFETKSPLPTCSS